MRQKPKGLSDRVTSNARPLQVGILFPLNGGICCFQGISRNHSTRNVSRQSIRRAAHVQGSEPPLQLASRRKRATGLWIATRKNSPRPPPEGAARSENADSRRKRRSLTPEYTGRLSNPYVPRRPKLIDDSEGAFAMPRQGATDPFRGLQSRPLRNATRIGRGRPADHRFPMNTARNTPKGPRGNALRPA
jgi:hypothetical protein